MPPLQRLNRPRTVDRVISITANRVLKESEAPVLVIFDSTTSLIATLPPPRKGLQVRFHVKQVAGSGVGHLIKTNGSTEKVFSKVSATGAAISESAGKGIVNTQATEVKGDGVTLESDGTDWYATSIRGTWAREA